MTTIDETLGRRAVRGILLNPDPKQLLALAFMLNPMEITFDKKPNYEIEEIPGFDDPIVTWISGGPEYIEFSLLFDATQGAVDSNLVKVINPLKGVLGYEAVIESFLRQRTSVLDEILEVPSIQPPPDCLFIYGLRWFQCKMLSAPFKEILHNKLLTPERITVPVRLIVKETGTFRKIRRIQRATLAYGESVASGANTVLTTLFS